MATSYRNSSSTHRVQNSSSDGEVSNSSDSDTTDALWSKKRIKPDSLQNSATATNGMPPLAQCPKPKRSKNANIWGSVLTQQNSNDISSSLGAVGMQHHISRGPESFDLPANLILPKLSRYSDSSDSSPEEVPLPATKIPEDKRKPKGSKRKRKKAKNRNNVPTFKPGQSVTLNRRGEISDSDPVDKVADEIAFRLWERKKDLIRSLTEVLGVPSAIDFCNKTEDIEKSGGLLIANGLRRRTPGGTFLYLIRNDPKLDQEPIQKIFALEAERDRMQWHVRKQSVANPDNCEMMETPKANCESNETLKTGENATSVCSNGNNVKHPETRTSDLSDGEIMDSGDEAAETFG